MSEINLLLENNEIIVILSCLQSHPNMYGFLEENISLALEADGLFCPAVNVLTQKGVDVIKGTYETSPNDRASDHLPHDGIRA